jgi:hypothetical protein
MERENMTQHCSRSLGLVLLALAVGPALAASEKSLPTKQNVAGQVTVSVTPQDLSTEAGTWRFAVQFNTHVSPIAQDLVAVTTLSDGKSGGEHPTAWEGDPPGGHHRHGVLVFKPIKPAPRSITLDIRQVGGIADRTFTWNLASP